MLLHRHNFGGFRRTAHKVGPGSLQSDVLEHFGDQPAKWSQEACRRLFWSISVSSPPARPRAGLIFCFRTSPILLFALVGGQPFKVAHKGLVDLHTNVGCLNIELCYLDRKINCLDTNLMGWTFTGVV